MDRGSIGKMLAAVLAMLVILLSATAFTRWALPDPITGTWYHVNESGRCGSVWEFDANGTAIERASGDTGGHRHYWERLSSGGYRITEGIEVDANIDGDVLRIGSMAFYRSKEEALDAAR